MKSSAWPNEYVGARLAVKLTLRRCEKWFSSRGTTTSFKITKDDSGTIASPLPRTKIFSMSKGELRSLASVCTTTSYCSPSRLNLVTMRPPMAVSTARAIASTGTPTSAARSRSTSMLISGLFKRRSTSTLKMPGFLAISSCMVLVTRARFS